MRNLQNQRMEGDSMKEFTINRDKLPDTVESLEELIKVLHVVFESDQVNIEYVNNLMQSYKSKESEWKKYAKFDRYKYTRNLVDTGNGKFNLIILCWGEGHGSPIHDHADSHCFMKMIKGELEEIRFAWPENKQSPGDEYDSEGMVEIGRTRIPVNDVAYINDSLGLHRVENPSNSNQAVSLHLYSPPYESCHMFDQKSGSKTKVQVTFWSKYGEKTG